MPSQVFPIFLYTKPLPPNPPMNSRALMALFHHCVAVDKNWTERWSNSRDYSSLFSSNLDYPLHPKPRWSNSRDFIISKLSSKNWAERWS